MKTEYTKYIVAYDSTGKHVEIVLDGHEPSEGHRKVGSFEANAVEGVLKGKKDFDTHGEHIFTAAAKQVLVDLGITDFEGMVYLDKASNAPTGDSYGMTHTDRDRAIRNGEDPVAKQTEISDNLDEAEAKFQKADKNQGSSKKNDAKPRSNS